MVAHAYAFLTLLDWQVNFRGVFETSKQTKNKQTNKNNSSILSPVQLHMHSISAIFFISTFHWIYPIIMHMPCKAQFLKGSMSTKKKYQNSAQYCSYYSNLALPSYPILFLKKIYKLSPTFTYMGN